MVLNIIRSLVWLLLIVIVGLGTTFIVADAIVNAQLNSKKPLLVRDSIGAGSHTLSGSVPVPSSCDEISVTTQQTSSTSYAILFTTWREPSISSCLFQQATREFHAVIFAPSFGILFTASLNGRSIPVAVIPDVPLQSQ